MLWVLFSLTLVWSLCFVVSGVRTSLLYARADVSHITQPIARGVFEEYFRKCARTWAVLALIVIVLNIYTGVLLWTM